VSALHKIVSVDIYIQLCVASNGVRRAERVDLDATAEGLQQPDHVAIAVKPINIMSEATKCFTLDIILMAAGETYG